MASEAEGKVGVSEAPDAEIQADTTADLKSDVLESEPSPAQPATHSEDDTPTQQSLPTHLEAPDTEVKVDTAAESKSDAPAAESSSTEATVSRGSSGLSKIAGVLSSSHVTPAQSLHMLVMPSTEDSSQEAQDMHDATSPDLDSLLSPKGTDTYFPIRESVATSDITEDDTRFSTVPLSARQSMETLHLSVDAMTTVAEVEDSDIGDSLYGSEIVRMVHQNRVHKKTPSTSTIVSANNVPFILARLEGDEVSNRKSLDGQQKLQEEFTRKHEVEGEAEPEAVVDWGFWGDVVSGKRHSRDPYYLSASKDPELEQTYLRLLKESSPHEKAITRDLGRTFPHHAFFTDGQGIGQENLFNVLKAYSL
ncbi:hypothetical protein PHLCEN_2v12360 [Hermanssonia centrifuga]|uniref:Rab-GAP TBC domain-containing protein n=1 Tax=Hermanssonia centrifuga TaxID=98765 RepID=A0A2R6NH94_9APHY|nr:hypothetical protein PHLCEN_2v12360 [Hermanssonia centrifuga]